MGRVVAEEFDAVGGPSTSSMGADGYKQGPTDAGEYLVSHCGRHVSHRYPDWSSIPWGTPLKEAKGALLVHIGGKWEPLARYSRVTKTLVEDQHLLLYGTRRVPPTWVFNDFGHATCYLYKDRNNNGRRDGTEKIHGEFIHTTPGDEAATKLGLPFALSESHGCVHVKPTGIDQMIKKGYLRRGTRVVVHRYSEVTHKIPRSRGPVVPPYEVHFFPGMKKIVVVGNARF